MAIFRTDFRREVSACRESHDANFPWIDVPFRSVKAHKSDGSLHILQRPRRCHEIVGTAITMPIIGLTRDAILQQDTRNASGCQPVADLGAFEVDRQHLEAAAGEHHDGSPGVHPIRGVDRHRRPSHVGDPHPWLASNQVFRLPFGFLPRNRLPIGRRIRPYRHLRMTRRWLPRVRKRVFTAKRNHCTKSKDQELHRALRFQIPAGCSLKLCLQSRMAQAFVYRENVRLRALALTNPRTPPSPLDIR